MTTPESLSGLVIRTLSLLRSNLIASKHSRCIVKSVLSELCRKHALNELVLPLKHLSILFTYSSDGKATPLALQIQQRSSIFSH